MRTRSIALLGGPASGKTTYLGALVDALQTNQTPRLRLGDIPEDVTAYDRLAEPLLDATYPQRTKEERHVLDLPLRARREDGHEDISLTMGDYDGEEVERLFDNRTHGFSPEWQARASACGLLIFIRPQALKPLPLLRRPPASCAALTTALAQAESVFGPGLHDEIPARGIAGPDDPVLVPTELAIIELLQFLRHVRGLGPGERPRSGTMRVALLVSAWDSVDPPRRDRGPAQFFVENAPLLEDYLWSNYHVADLFHFGLSSTGGDLRDPRYQDEYLGDRHGFVGWSDSSGRIQSTPNLALPIEWALFGDPALTLAGTHS
jgi:hypothetical protein